MMDPGDPSSTQVLPVGDNWGTYFSFYGPYVAVVLVLLLLAALASAAEAAFFSLSAQDRLRCRASEDQAEQRIAELLDRPKRLLASLVNLNNLFNVAIVLIVTYLTGMVSGWAHGSGWILAGVTLVTALMIVLFGEMVPKIYASQHALAVSRGTQLLARVALVVFAPLSSLAGQSEQPNRQANPPTRL